MDIRLVQFGSPFEAVTIDWLLKTNGQLDTSYELATAVTVALCTDRWAEADDVLPNPDSNDRRGWWGDVEAEDIWDGWPIGCRLWLMAREKITGIAARQGSTTARIESYIHEAIQPMIDRGMASAAVVDVQRVGLDRVDATVTLVRGGMSDIELRFQNLWGDPGQTTVTVKTSGFTQGFTEAFV